MSYFLQNGDMFSPTPSRDSVLETLPVGNYIVIETMQGLMFRKADPFTAPGRMYGNIDERAQRILDTFMDRPRATGVLLSGEKGSGKSQLARNISYAAYDMGVPTILVNQPFAGDAFNALLASIEQPAIVLMDEFEKVYEDRGAQEQVLTLLDGVMTTKKLFVMTVNDRYRVNEHMHNRPGRIYYSITFNGIESEFVREYCNDNLDDKDEIENVMKVGAMFAAFNFDMLKAIVEEMNRYKETAFDAIKMLNAKPITQDEGTTYTVTTYGPKGIHSIPVETTELPMGNRNNMMSFYVRFDEPVEAGEKDKVSEMLGLDDDFERHLVIRSSDLKRIDVDAGRYEFKIDGNFTVVFEKKSRSYYDMSQL